MGEINTCSMQGGVVLGVFGSCRLWCSDGRLSFRFFRHCLA